MLSLHVGTYTRNGGAGLHRLVRSADRGWGIAPAYPGARNASFGAFSVRRGLAYLVDESRDGRIGIFRQTEAGWHRIVRVTTLGREPCYLALDADETALAVANYGSGSIALYRLDAAGLPLGEAATYAHAGHGPVEDRQEAPHAHCACFSRDQDWLYQVDLGTDEVVAHRLAAGILSEHRIAFRAPGGTGPRHLVLHPVLPFALLLGELDSSLTVLDVTGDKMKERQRVSTLPPDFTGDSLGGHLSVNAVGDRVYVTNRGHDSVATFAWGTQGALTLLQHAPSGGASPRALALLEAERQLLLANEESGSVSVFDMLDDGTLRLAGAPIAVPGAAFLLVAGNEPASTGTTETDAVPAAPGANSLRGG